MSATPWESAAEAAGSTDSEQALARLARRAFLTLWSYPNVYTDEGRRNGRGDGKELCDLLVVFGNTVLIFSDKHCAFSNHPDVKVAWSRWYRRAIDKSARQLVGAKHFLKEFPGRVFLDKQCTTPLPVNLPDPSIARFYLIAVSQGAHRAVEKNFGGGSSGSLILDSGIVGERHGERPFRIGYPVVGQFIHIWDEWTVDLILSELDTMPDLLGYLEAKEAYVGCKNVVVTVMGEEDLLGRYLCTTKKGMHCLPTIPPGTAYVVHPEGDWHFWVNSPQRVAKRQADAASYMWDHLIENHSDFIRAGTAIGLPGLDTTSGPEHEMVLRVMAGESRLSRRKLAADLKYAMLQSKPGHKFARISLSDTRPGRAYVFLTAPRPAKMSYQEFREARAGALVTYCHGVQLKLPGVTEAVGIACEPASEPIVTWEFVHVELGRRLSTEETAELRQAMREVNVLQSPSLQQQHASEREYPPFDYIEQPVFNTIDGQPMNRKARRAQAAQARRDGRPSRRPAS